MAIFVCQREEEMNEQIAEKALFLIVTIAMCPKDINILIDRVSKNDLFLLIWTDIILSVKDHKQRGKRTEE